MSQQLENIEEQLANHKLSQEDYTHIKQILNREPNLVELGIFSAMWSEHCSYKSSKVHLKGFPTKAPWVIQGPGENAGVIDIGGGYAAVFKMESHNHPSFIEPYQGAATGVGGIMRDVFTMGARPVASLNALRFGNILNDDKTSAHQRYLVRGVTEGIGGYGNCMGVPTIGGEVSFDECYNGNILVNAFNLGIAKSDEIFLGRAEGIGNPVMYVGAKTGRDGLGGAVMSSDSFTEESKSLRPTVQVGDPFTEKLLLEACMELFKTDHVVGIQDMGAAGLTSSSFEMAGRTGSGMTMHLDKVPAREENMTPYDFMLSESQERMLLCAKKGSEQAIIDIFEKWDLDAAVIGEVTDTGNMELFWHGEKCAEVPVDPVSEEAPELNRPMSRPVYLDSIANVTINDFGKVSNQDAFEKLIKSMEVVDKSWIYTQYDSMVQTNTIKKGGMLDASVIRVKENGKALAMSADCNVRYCYIDPKGGAAAAVIESGRNVAMSGARPLAITDCLNYGNPENPEVMWQFAQGCLGIKEACAELTTPVIGGNVSLYNETNGISVFPTPSIATVGVNDDQNNVLMSSFQSEGNALYLVGGSMSEFGGSLYMKEICGIVAGTLPEIDYKKELALWDLVIEGNKKHLLECAKDASSGGVAIALAKMSATSGLGCDVEMSVEDERDIFAESMSRAIIEVKPENCEAFEAMLDESFAVEKIGTVGGDSIKVNDVTMSMDILKDNYFNTFKRVIERDL
ncbi:phosphoribosylformylglycinamidine synthase 2 [Sulfurimonas gotlandica GD1]|uniref:Phosphoribosylformylglycinamidine synthase subunit PurL n=1 Tax=Sulfurimonas gotlandica (strain DSM 19862 / JCM 16533 / GD1) TaxID=929558 RepID=B6BIS5_SULGG|nr:phosphoribosylformylglycinamidine synthase subunit PurL [Sulfurimonas gotlandica]EDZ63305.1 phosphoribosylformylglycinamidine synthase II [Sulfurimonas gotlandica GD1]EHP30435.1 phosphoribosylformylglycinamidine synthase 2 [Sulfurimonas gotlandica GD1]